MKKGLWVFTALALLVWTAGMATLAELSQWLAAQLPQWVEGLPPVLNWPQPAWLAFWVDPALLQSLQGFMVWLLELLRPLAPSMAGLGTVVSVLVWLLWGLGLILGLGLGLALAGHLLIRRHQRRRMGLA